MLDWLTPGIQSQVLDGLVVTLWLTAITSVAAIIVGYRAGLALLGDNRLGHVVAATFVQIFRNVPALILVIFFGFAVPNVVPLDARQTLFFDNDVVDLVGSLTGVPIPYYAMAATFALTLNTGAHLAEIFRSGFSSVPQSRIDVARSLGASHADALRSVVAPIGIRIAFPAVSNRLIHNLKNTSLASFLAVPELFQVVQSSISRTFRATDILVFAALLYLALAFALSILLSLIGRLLGGVPGAVESAGV